MLLKQPRCRAFPRSEVLPKDGRQNHWQLVASQDGRDGSMRIHQDAKLSVLRPKVPGFTPFRVAYPVPVNG